MSNRNFSEEQLREIISLFQVYGDITGVSRYGSGHINDTFRVWISLGGTPVSYILQRINDGIFNCKDERCTEQLEETAFDLELTI